MPKFTDDEKRKYYEQIYNSHKISQVEKYKEETRKFKRKGDLNYEQ